MQKAAQEVYKKRRFEERLSSVLKKRLEQKGENEAIREAIERILPVLHRRRVEKRVGFEAVKEELLLRGEWRRIAANAERTRSEKKAAERSFEEARREMERQLRAMHKKQEKRRSRENGVRDGGSRRADGTERLEERMTPIKWVLSTRKYIEKLTQIKVSNREKEEISLSVEKCWEADEKRVRRDHKEQDSEKVDACEKGTEKQKSQRVKGKRRGESLKREGSKKRWVMHPRKRDQDEQRKTRVRQRWWKFPSPGPP